MLKSLYPQINWEDVSCVGFDMDGTLYDEYEFIQQVYKPIAEVIANSTNRNIDDVYNAMLLRWLEKGSSYNRLFDEYLASNGLEGPEKLVVVDKCLHIFRSFSPTLKLTGRVSTLLNYFKKNIKNLFLVTDGNFSLQQAKYRSLGLEQWFSDENVVFTGLYGREFVKPSVHIPSKVKVLQHIENPQNVVFFGDREQDRLFASVLNYQFVHTYCLR